MVRRFKASPRCRHRPPLLVGERARRGLFLFLLLIAGIVAAPAIVTAAEPPADEDGPASIGVLSAGSNSTDVRIIGDMAEVLDGPRLRIVPIIGQGGLRNVEDLLALPVADVAIIQADVATALNTDEGRKSVRDKVVYIAKLFNEEVHVLARREIQTLADLAGRTVAVGTADSGSSLTATAIFSALSIPIQPLFEAPASALAKLNAGEIAAIVYVAGRPTTIVEQNNATTPESGPLHFLAIPTNERLLADYVPAALTHQDYPDLIAEGQTIDTIAVPMVMIAAAKPAGENDGLVDFVNAFFSQFARLQEPSRHPKWRETNLAATIPGWKRLPASVDWVRANMATPEERRLQEAFTDILLFIKEQNIKPEAKMSEEQSQALFWRFVDWRAERSRP